MVLGKEASHAVHNNNSQSILRLNEEAKTWYNECGELTMRTTRVSVVVVRTKRESSFEAANEAPAKKI